MNRVWHIKIPLICVIFAAHSYCSALLAESIQFAVDASLSSQELSVAGDVVMTITQATNEFDNVGLLIYDAVFQRSVPLASATEQQRIQLLRTLGQITPSESSNLAVALEKGTSELADNGYLIVFGNSEINIDDVEKIKTYSDWLGLVLLPEAEKKGISVLLADPSPEDAANSFQLSVTEFIPWADTAAIVGNLSTLLPESIRNRIQQPVSLTTLPQTPELAVSGNETAQELSTSSNVSSTSNAQNPDQTLQEVSTPEARAQNLPATAVSSLTRMEKLLFVISGALLITLIAISCLIYKLTRKAKASGNITRSADLYMRSDLAHLPGRDRQQDTTIINAQHTAASETLRHESNEKSSGNLTSDSDATVQCSALEGHDLDMDATLKRPAVSGDEMQIENKEAISDDLQEIRDLTQQKKKTLV